MRNPFFLLVVSIGLEACGRKQPPVTTAPPHQGPPPGIETGTRDPLKHPFASTSPWNMPIGDGAEYIHAGLKRSKRFGVYVEEEILILTPDAPLVPVYENYADWNKGEDRNSIDGPEILKVPIPDDFITDHPIGDTPNHAGTVLLADGRTLHHSQPLHREKPGGPATSHFVFPDTDLYGDGIGGAHGGSGLSALGGTIRLGELVPGGEIRHSLKIVMTSNYFRYRKDGTPGYRWPAGNADGHASRFTYTGKLDDLEMGSLLALKPDFDIGTLETEPAKIIARAARDYGIYICDTVGPKWDAFYLATEWSPDGRVIEEFEEIWGYPYVMKDLQHPWSKDFARIIEALHVIRNNGPESVGGGGTPRRALLPELVPPNTSQ